MVVVVAVVLAGQVWWGKVFLCRVDVGKRARVDMVDVVMDEWSC